MLSSAVLRSDFLTQGPLVPRFERRLAEYCGAEHAVAVNSGTSALHIACLALGIGRGDRVWTSAITFVASANCALYCGATVDFVDIDPRTFNICPRRSAPSLSRPIAMGSCRKPLLPCICAGNPATWKAFTNWRVGMAFRLSKMPLTQSARGTKGSRSAIAALATSRCSAFIRSKSSQPAEGGAALTNDAAFAERMALFAITG